MTDLLRKPNGDHGLIHDFSAKEAGWKYVGFSVFQGHQGETINRNSQESEIILVVVEGRVRIIVDDIDFGEIGERLSVFERSAPHCVYAPGGADISIEAMTKCSVAFCTAPALGNYEAQRLGPDGITLQERGEGTNKRYIHNIAMEDRDVAGSLLVTEVFTPAGHWSSYPPHRHDEDDFPNITYLEETYYHRLNPAQGFGIQRVFTEDGTLDETMSVSDHDVVLVPRGHHPCSAPHGYEMYYLNVMAGPKRKWRFQNHPDHEWMVV